MNPERGYRKVTRNGAEFFCRRDRITGSLTKTMETCLTRAQMDAKAKESQDLMRRIQSVPGSSPGVDARGGMSMGVMSQ